MKNFKYSFFPFRLFSLIFSLLSLIFLFSCSEKPTFENLFDPEVDISVNNLTYERLAIDRIKLFWENTITSSNGIITIDKKVGTGNWQESVAVFNSEATTWTDTFANINQNLKYRICVLLDENQSDSIETGVIDNTFPSPDSLQYQHLTISSIQLIWDDNSNGEEGFKIVKKVGSTPWDSVHAFVGEDEEEWTDENAEINEILQYRVYAFSGNNNSTSIETGEIDNTFPAPTNLLITQTSFTSCELNWNYSGFGDEEGFKIERRLSGGSWSQIAVLDISDTNYEDTGLTEEETYEYQIYAYYSSYISNAVNETIELQLMVVDIDGNVYQVVQIGNQFWMAENLKVTRYRNGDAISHLTDNGDWTNTNSGAYCVFNNTPSNADTYGNLYNWYAVADSRNIAPEGWYVPSDEDIMELEMYLGMSQSQANSMGWRGTNEGSKLAGNADLWSDGSLENDPEFGSSGFCFLPGGYRSYYNGHFGSLGSNGYFWSSTEYNTSNALTRNLLYNLTEVYRYRNYKQNGYSVRCVRD